MRVSLTGEAELGFHKTVTELISLASFVKIVPSGHANNGLQIGNVRTTVIIRHEMGSGLCTFQFYSKLLRV